MSSQPLLGEIVPFAGNFAPRGYMACDGQLLPISQNTALFSLLGTMYGGDGRTTFALPDLRGRHGLHLGQGPGLGNHNQGEVGGSETVTLTPAQLPSHTHTLRASNTGGTSGNPAGNHFASANASQAYGDIPTEPTKTKATTAMSSALLAAEAAGTHNNMPPFLALIFIIAVEGIFPSRS